MPAWLTRAPLVAAVLAASQWATVVAQLGSPNGTCGDVDGAANGTAGVTDGDCGHGFVYNSAARGVVCAGSACNVSLVAADNAACCMVARHVFTCPVPGYVADNGTALPTMTVAMGCALAGHTYNASASVCTASSGESVGFQALCTATNNLWVAASSSCFPTSLDECARLCRASAACMSFDYSSTANETERCRLRSVAVSILGLGNEHANVVLSTGANRLTARVDGLARHDSGVDASVNTGYDYYERVGMTQPYAKLSACVYGCTEPNASNFNENARANDGSCVGGEIAGPVSPYPPDSLTTFANDLRAL
jgi:hypothetical protein